MNERPFLEQMLNGFAKYNVAIWPMQVVAYVLGGVALFFALKRTGYSSGIIAGILSFLCLWIAIVPSLIDPPRAFSLLDGFCILSLIIQGLMFLAEALKPRMSFGFQRDVYSTVGLLFIVYAMVGYPVFGYLLGHRYPQSPPFGLVPCPTLVFTIGLLLLTDQKVPKRFLVVPIVWGVIGALAVYVGVWEDIGLVIAGVLGSPLILYRDKIRRPAGGTVRSPQVHTAH